jgi:hypothetical protein
MGRVSHPSLPVPPGPSEPPSTPSTAATSGPGAPGAWPRADTAVAVVFWVGVALRVVQYLARHSLWFDEAALALTVGTGLPGAVLTRPHRSFFLLLEWAATRVGGVNELALRAVPCAAGIGLLVALRRLARRLLEPPVVWFAVALAALSPALIYHTTEMKPYGIDALVSVLLLLGALGVVESRGSRPAWRRLLVGGAVALLVSIPAALVLTGIGLALATAPELRRDRTTRRQLAVTLALWGAALAVLYVVLYRATANDAFMQWFWAGGFLTPWSPDFWHRAAVLSRSVLGEFFVGGSMDLAAVGVVGLLSVVGLVALARQRGRAVAVCLAAPIAVTLAASAAALYPIAARTVLFGLPLAILALTAGVGWLVDRLPPTYRPAALALGGVLWLAPALGADWDRTRQPERPEEARPVIAEFNRRQRPGEPVYLYGGGVPAWLFYTTDWTAPDTARLRRETELVWNAPRVAIETAPRGGPSGLLVAQAFAYPYRGRCELIGIRSGMDWRIVTGYDRSAPDPGWADNEAARMRAVARPSVWLFFSHFDPAERTALLAATQHAGGRLATGFQAEGAELYEYRFDGTRTLGSAERPRGVRPRASFSGPCAA